MYLLSLNVKLRPIVSCVNSPTEKLAWLAAHICTPLLQKIPSHLNNLHDYLTRLRDLNNDQRKGLQFYSADVNALYTNIDPRQTIQDLMNMIIEFWDDTPTYGLTLSDIESILEVVFNNSYFCYDSKVFLQLMGLFMGLRPSPIGAIVRVYTFERNSIYTDITYITIICYGRYIDDMGDLQKSLGNAEKVVDQIAQSDPDKRLSFEIDFPSEEKEFIPFLNSEIKINEDGSLCTKLFRKPQKKLITLHFRSYHAMKTKVHTVRNSYREAILIASPDQTEASMKMVDQLYLNNGYKHPRGYISSHKTFNPNYKPRFNKSDSLNHMIKLPFVSDQFSADVDHYIQKFKLPFTIIYTGAKTLRDLFCSTRPLDKVYCSRDQCTICERLDGNTCCAVSGVVYRIHCTLCGEDYVGETGRTLYERLIEHWRFASNPTMKSYKEKTIAKHYLTEHPNLEPDLKFEILYRESNTLKRKVQEAYCILHTKPGINEKQEMETVQKFIL